MNKNELIAWTKAIVIALVLSSLVVVPTLDWYGLLGNVRIVVFVVMGCIFFTGAVILLHSAMRS